MKTSRQPRLLMTTMTVALCLAADAALADTLELDIPGNSIGFSDQTGMLYVTVPSRAGLPYGNDLVEIDPATARVARSVFVGSEPTPLALSPDSPTAFVGLEGAASAREIDLTTMQTMPSFSLDPNDREGPVFATEIAVLPGNPHSVAVSLHNKTTIPDYEGVAVFDSGVIRANMIDNFDDPIALTFGSDPSVLYGNRDSPAELTTSAITSSGISVTTRKASALAGHILAHQGLIYSTSGAVIDESTFGLVGTYQSKGSFVVDDAMSTVTYVVNHLLQVYDRDTFIPLFQIALANASGAPVGAARCGTACVAVVFDSDQIIVVPNVTEDIFSDGFE